MSDYLLNLVGVLPPCERVGGEGDWWVEQHTSCTGAAHPDTFTEVVCVCECHKNPRAAEARGKAKREGTS